MKLRRNTTANGDGKYSLYNRAKGIFDPDQNKGGENEFFVIKLKDVHAPAALEAYAASIEGADSEFAAEVRELAEVARNHPHRKQPD